MFGAVYFIIFVYSATSLKNQYQNMQLYERYIPDYLIRRGNLVRTVIFTAAFALAFINIYDPFGVDSYLELSGIRLFLYSSFVILTGMLVVVISRVAMYYFGRYSKLNYWRYVLWIFAEIVVMAFVYSIYLKFILLDERDFMNIFSISLKNTALVLLLPYTILWLYFSWQDKSIRLEELAGMDNTHVKTGTEMIHFHDEFGKLRLSVLQHDLLYLEAADNYVTIHYLHHDKPQKFMVRNSLRFFEDRLKDSRIVRCHRSYMVNLDKVRIIRREKDGMHLELDAGPLTSILVTKTYLPGLIEAFSKHPPANL